MFQTAKWIWAENNTKKNDWVVFKKDFIADTKGSYVLKIAADTRYFLKINGKYVVIDGSLLRDAHCEHSGFVDSVDISAFVKKGKNQMEILVWHYGNGGRNNNTTDAGGLIFECDKLNLYSNRETLCARHPAYGDTQPPYPSYLYGGYNIGFNANKTLNESDFKPSEEYSSNLYGKMFSRPIPLFRFSNVKLMPCVKKGETYSVKLPFAQHVLPYFKVKASGGEIIDVRSDRYSVRGGPGDHHMVYNGHRTEYICKEGINEFLVLDWVACEELIFSMPKSVKVIGLGYRISEYDTDFNDILKTSNKELNKLLQKCALTLKFCMRDNFMDCPDRERGQWIGDVSVQAPQVFYALDNKAVPLLKKAIMDFILLRKGNVLVGNVPGENFIELPSQSLNAISEIGMIANYYYFTGDKDLLSIVLEPAVNYLKLWKMDENGLVINRKGDDCWFDHLFNADKAVLENCWYYSALNFALQMSKILKNNKHTLFLEERINLIKENFDKAFWKGKYYSSSVVDDRANAMAVLCGLASEEKYSLIKDILITVFNSSVYMEGYVCEALCKMGYSKLAFNRLMSRYYNLINNDNSTLWEDFYLLGTKNHAWSGSPLTIIYKYFLGIESKDFFNTVIIRPDFSISNKYVFSLDIKGNKIKFNLKKKSSQKTVYKIKNKSKIKILTEVTHDK